MNHIVLDMEWNQPYNTKAIARGNVQLTGEIIQIGAVKLDEAFNTIDTFKIMVAPKYYKKMHEYVERITKITTEELQHGLSFPAAFAIFRKWCGTDFVFLTWGPDDVGILRDNMEAHGLDTDWVPASYDVQMIFARQMVGKKQQTSLSAAMAIIDQPALTAHDALNDAKNTACVCRYLDMISGIENYLTMWDNLPGEIVEAEGIDAREYDSRKRFFADKSFREFACPVCQAVAKCGELVRQNSEKYIAEGTCEKGHELFVRYKFKRVSRRKYRVSRMIYEMDAENKAYYDKKKGNPPLKNASGSN